MSPSRRQSEQSKAPVQVGKVYETAIHGLGHSGEGVGRVESFTVFINGAIPGDVVRAKITEVKKNFSRASIEEVVQPSDNRVSPTCPHYESCGGCQLQHMAYEAQKDWKRQQVVDALTRIGNLQTVTVHNTLGMETPLYYRNKAQYPVGMHGDEVVMGFYERGTHSIVDLAGCQIEQEINSEILRLAKRLIMEQGISVYDEAAGIGHIRHVVVRSSRTTGEAMVVFVTNGSEVPGLMLVVESLTKELPQIVSVAQSINTANTNVIFGKETRIIWGRPAIVDYIGDLKFEISPRSFFQVNPVQTEVLYSKALEYADLSGDENVFDLYCGIGTISLFLARKARTVIGIDDVPEAIEDARRNAKINQMDNVRFITGKVEQQLPQLKESGVATDVVVVDPPRAGCDEVVLQTLIEQRPRRIVYVSCYPSTLARDLAYLVAGGKYVVQEVQPVDMFPHTSHVECVVLVESK